MVNRHIFDVTTMLGGCIEREIKKLPADVGPDIVLHDHNETNSSGRMLGLKRTGTKVPTCGAEISQLMEYYGGGQC